MKKEEILEYHNKRYACKEFDKTKKISEEDFKIILEAGRLSPTSFGYEPFKFLIIQNEELRQKLKNDEVWGAQGHLDTASHFVICLAMKSPLVKAGSEYLDKFMREIKSMNDEAIEKRVERYDHFQKNDFDLTDDRKIFDWSCKQTYIVMGNMMTTASMLGIDSCPIEGFNISKSDKFVEKELGVNIKEYGISYMLAFGYKNGEQPKKTRRNLEDIIKIY